MQSIYIIYMVYSISQTKKKGKKLKLSSHDY